MHARGPERVKERLSVFGLFARLSEDLRMQSGAFEHLDHLRRIHVQSLPPDHERFPEARAILMRRNQELNRIDVQTHACFRYSTRALLKNRFRSRDKGRANAVSRPPVVFGRILEIEKGFAETLGELEHLGC